MLSELRRTLSDHDARVLQYQWDFWARPNQLPPAGDWRTWLILAGRGWGKTRTGAEWVRAQVESGKCKRIAILNDTSADVRKVNIHGPDGLIAVSPPWNKPTWNGSYNTLTWPNGAVALAYSAEAPEELRGPQHDAAWADEPAKWKNLRKKDVEGGTAWDNLMLGLRMGSDPRCVATTTPRPIPLIKELLKRANVHITRGNTFENADNMTEQWFEEVKSLYEGTRLGRQELYAEVLEDIEGALWNLSMIDDLRVAEAPAMKRIVVAIDPAVSTNEGSAETGIVVAGLGMDGHGYVLADVSGKFTPDGWVQRVVKAYHEHNADRVVAEINNGGNLVGYALRTVNKHIPYKELHASRGKRTRAEPVAALYEQKKVHHVGAPFEALENQLCTWDASANEDSPDRLDALVWALTELMLEQRDVVAAVTPKHPVGRR